MNGLWNAVDRFYQTGEYPVDIGVHPAPGEGPGHALVGYRVEEVSDTEGWVYVYDCNAPLSRNEYITLTKDSPDGAYTHFSYREYDWSLSYSVNKGPMLWRYSGSPAASGELNFDDVGEISGYALEALRWAVENGILNGYGDGRLAPQGRATRAQAAQMLKNFIENQESKQ